MYLSGKSITNNNKYNAYNYNPAAIKFQCIFAWLILTLYVLTYVKHLRVSDVLSQAILSKGCPNPHKRDAF